LWISAADNLTRIRQFSLEEKIIPLHCEARALPFAEGYFDAVISIDAYHYFAADEEYLREYLSPLIKQGGQIAVVVPGIGKEFQGDVPQTLQPFVTMEMNFHSCQWWRDLWQKSGMVADIRAWELTCFQEAWDDWLRCKNDYAVIDREMFKAGAANYLNMVAIKATKI
jgi:SAM-dependent methyltransferase